MEALATHAFAPAGLASLTCDERGTGDSQGSYDLAGPNDVADVQALFAWFTARSDISDTEIGAYGEAAGGAEVWNAAVAGVPFKAIVPAYTWTSLADALHPHGVLDTSLLALLTLQGSPSWNTAQGISERSPRGALHSLAVPTLMIQSRQGLLFDLGQATAAYKLLAGPKRLFVGDGSEKSGMPAAVAWFTRYLAAGPSVGNGVELEHEPADGTTTVFRTLPSTRSVSVNLPGRAASRTVRLPGGPLETFGGGSVAVRYSGASASWTQLVATVSVAGSKTVVTEGATPIKTTSGVATIPLLDQAVLLPRGKRIVVTLGFAGGVFGEKQASNAKIALGRETLDLSVLQRAVSR